MITDDQRPSFRPERFKVTRTRTIYGCEIENSGGDRIGILVVAETPTGDLRIATYTVTDDCVLRF